MQNEILEAAKKTAAYIAELEIELQHYKDHVEYLQSQVDHYIHHFGTYEDVQAQALAPSEDAFDFTPTDMDELTRSDAGLTDDQMHAYYELSTEIIHSQNNA